MVVVCVGGKGRWWCVLGTWRQHGFYFCGRSRSLIAPLMSVFTCRTFSFYLILLFVRCIAECRHFMQILGVT